MQAATDTTEKSPVPTPAPRRQGLAFRLFGFPVEIDLSFFLVMAILSWSPGQPMTWTATWVGALFLSVLWHELGHALAFRRYGHEAAIRVSSMFGMAYSQSKMKLERSQDLVISAAGPAATLLLAGVTWLIWDHATPSEYWVRVVVVHLFVVNMFLGLANLLPILPLDGGRIAKAFLEKLFPTTGLRITHGLSFLVAAGVVIFSVAHQLQIMALIALMYGAMNFRALRRPAPATV